MGNKRIDQPTGTETVGHEWDGIEELNTPLPRWWLWSFYACILFAIGYVVVYPAIPLLSKGTEGLWGWTSRGELADEMQTANAAQAKLHAELVSVPIEELTQNDALMQQAVAGGRAAFKVNCVQCHGSGAAGSEGYPNLNDDDWLWGGDIKAIETTLLHGIRQPGDDKTRNSVMPPFAGAFSGADQNALVDQVLSFSGKGKANAKGAKIYAENCLACHGDGGVGDRKQGAPALNDAIWLYGSSRAAISSQINGPRMGMMPKWQGRLDAVTIRMLAAYVYSLGGGEEIAPDTAVETPSEAAEAETGADEQS